MNTICKGVKKASTVGATAALLVAMAPSVALAEEGASGADILLPKPAEFVPALIAFLIIFAVVAKFVWPSVLRMLDKRQEKIQGDLDAAAKAREEANRIVKSQQLVSTQLSSKQTRLFLLLSVRAKKSVLVLSSRQRQKLSRLLLRVRAL